MKKTVSGLSRLEYEYIIPLAEAEELLSACCTGSIVEKTRYRIAYRGFTWEVDEFLGENAGLIVAEVELESEDQSIELPEWVGEEVSEDCRYLNSALSQHPYSHW